MRQGDEGDIAEGTYLQRELPPNGKPISRPNFLQCHLHWVHDLLKALQQFSHCLQWENLYPTLAL